MATVTVHAAKTHLSRLIRRAEAGEEIVIARGDRPVVRLTPIASKTDRSKGFGSMAGRAEIGSEFFEPLPDEDLEAWYR